MGRGVARVLVYTARHFLITFFWLQLPAVFMATPLQATLTEGRVSEQLKILALPLVWGLMHLHQTIIYAHCEHREQQRVLTV